MGLLYIEMQSNNGSTTYKTRFDLAIAAYEHTAQYDGMIANYFGKMVPDYTEEAAEVPPAGVVLTVNFAHHHIE